MLVKQHKTLKKKELRQCFKVTNQCNKLVTKKSNLLQNTSFNILT